MRQVAAWALARTADLDVVPDLITALLDPEEDVVSAARTGLQLLSRKIDGLGPPSSVDARPAERGRQGVARLVRRDPPAGCGRGR